MNLSVVYGTRPEFLKIKVLIQALKAYSCFVIRIDQHKDYKADIGYYDHCIRITKQNENNRLSDIGSAILTELPKYISKSNYVLVHGDTATSYFAALCAFNMNIKIIHLEAGMRTYNLQAPFPEEAYRQMISRIATIHLCPSSKEYNNLLGEKINPQNIYITGNTILDLVKQYEYSIYDTNCVIITLHRRENWNNYKYILEQICLLCEQNPQKIFYFIKHSNPCLSEQVIETFFSVSNCVLLENVCHEEIINLLSTCSCVITDSGGIQEEANFLGKFLYIVRDFTERNSIPPMKYRLVSADCLSSIDVNVPQQSFGFEYGDGNSVETIMNIFASIDDILI